MDIEIRQAERENAEWIDTESEKLAYAKYLKTAFDSESEKLDAYAEYLETSFEAKMNAIEGNINSVKKALRGSNLPMADKLAGKRKISDMEGRRDKLKLEFFERRASIRAEVEAMLDLYQKGGN